MDHTETLLEKLKTTDDTEEKVSILNELSERNRTKDLALSLKLANDAIKLSNDTDNKTGLAHSYWQQGVCYRLLSDFKAAFNSFENALRLYNEINEKKGIAKVLNSIANLYADIHEHNKALELLKKSHEMIKQTEDIELEAIILSNIGLQYQYMGNYEMSIDNYKDSIKKFTEINSVIHETLYNNIGNVYASIGNYTTALEYYYKCLELCDISSNPKEKGYAMTNIADTYGKLNDPENAAEYFNSGLKLLDDSKNISEINFSFYTPDQKNLFMLDFNFKLLKLREQLNDQLGICSSLITIGDIYFSNSDFANANNYFNDCYKYAFKIKNDVYISNALLKCGYVELYKNNIERAIEYLDNANDNALNRNAIRELSRINFALYEAYKKSGNFMKALKHHEEFFNYEQELIKLNSDKTLLELVEKQQYELKVKERTINEQESEIYRLKNVELANLNQELLKSNQEKNEFIGIAAHDLKNPLSGILSVSKRLSESSERYNPTEVSEFAGEIVKASEKMFDLITKMLDISRIESGNRMFTYEQIDPSLIFERVIFDNRAKAMQKNIDLIIENNAKDKILIKSDKTALRQIFDNLITNAIKFSPSGKKIYLRIGLSDNKIKFEIQDEGPGLTDKDKEKLFIKFTRLSAIPTAGESSTGLGLSIAKKLTESLNGLIYCESRIGDGANFIVEFPT